MKKCNFFPVLVVALFMFLGFSSSAQSYKPVTECITLVGSTVEQSQALVTSVSQTNTVNYQTSQSMLLSGMKDRIGSELLQEFKNNSDVAKAFENVAANFSVSAQRAQAKSEVINFYKQLLTL